MLWQAKLNTVLRSWEGTPWQAGQASKGQAVDCRFFVLAVMDELHGITEPLPQRLPQDTSRNNRPLALASIRQITTRYPCRAMDEGEAIEPGDVVIVRSAGTQVETLQHVMIASAGEPISLWHAGQGGVCFTGLEGWIVEHVFRSTMKESWNGQ